MRVSFTKLVLVVVLTTGMLLLHSCGTKRSYLVIPHSVSTASAVTVEDLRLEPGQYEVLNAITESASVICEYKGSEIHIVGGDGDFSYTFKYDYGKGWSLAKFSGAAALGYFSNDFIANPSETPNPEEFARRVAMARIINAAKDYQADGVIEPVVVTSVDNLGKNKVEYRSSVTAKLIVIKTSK